jgi:hypothetical protein
MDLLYFFFLGIIFTLMSLDNNNALKSKELRYNKDEKAPAFKIIFDILIAWFFAGNALFFLHVSVSLINNYMSNLPRFSRNIILLVNLINIFIMPFILFKRVLIRDKNQR